MSEFTGERVIPGLVDTDLFNEHLARYRFARQYARGLHARNILDAGCGSGYGTAELAIGDVVVIGTDISADAVRYASEHYRKGVRFLQAACEALPFAAGSFDLVVAFEVIEHLDRWQELLTEAKRVLKPSGVLLVSTPNRDYYAESRGASGPNPFHRHEFDFREFTQSLSAVFQNGRIWTQNHTEAIVFSPQRAAGGVLETADSGNPALAHFYLAACSQSPFTNDQDAFAWVPSSANLLRERELHIAKLNGELEKKDAWLRQTIADHADLQSKHEAVTKELERQNNWAAELDREIAARKARIDELQNELATRLSWIADLESQIAGARIEIERLTIEAIDVRRKGSAEIDRIQIESAKIQATLNERTQWAQRLDAEIAEYREELQRIRSSQWYRTGAKLGLGPRVRDGQ